ncbi:MAG: MFS transporter, partial [Terracoccus sp.]
MNDSGGPAAPATTAGGTSDRLEATGVAQSDDHHDPAVDGSSVTNGDNPNSSPREQDATHERPAPATKTEAPDPRRWKALAVCLVAGFMTLLDVSIVNVALPSIATSLGAGDASLQWIVSGYALTFGLLLVPAGRFGDARGRRSAFLLGLVLFVVASMACGLAPSPGWLVGARLLQGFAGGLLTPQVSGLIQQLFRGAERAKAFGALGASIGFSTAVGP